MNNSEQGSTTNKKSIAYKSGYLLGVVLVGCTAAIALALTIKFISWLF